MNSTDASSSALKRKSPDFPTFDAPENLRDKRFAELMMTVSQWESLANALFRKNDLVEEDRIRSFSILKALPGYVQQSGGSVETIDRVTQRALFNLNRMQREICEEREKLWASIMRNEAEGSATNIPTPSRSPESADSVPSTPARPVSENPSESNGADQLSGNIVTDEDWISKVLTFDQSI